MPKQVIVIMQNHYPFGQCQQSMNERTRVLVRKIYSLSLQQRNKLLQKTAILRKLKSEQMIKIESVLEEDQSLHFLFEYVPIRLETWISNINQQFIENFRDQLIKFSSYLANNFIKTEFKLKNIGMDHNYGAKYFLDPSFVVDPNVNKERLKSQYIRDITKLFKPYIEGGNASLISQQQLPVITQNKNTDKDSDKHDKGYSGVGEAYQNQGQAQVQVQYQNQDKGNQYYQLQPKHIHNQISTHTSETKKQPQTVNQSQRRNMAISPPTYNNSNSADQQQQLLPNGTTTMANKTKKKLQKYYQEMNASMDVQNEKILQEFMNVLDDEEEEFGGGVGGETEIQRGEEREREIQREKQAERQRQRQRMRKNQHQQLQQQNRQKNDYRVQRQKEKLRQSQLIRVQYKHQEQVSKESAQQQRQRQALSQNNLKEQQLKAQIQMARINAIKQQQQQQQKQFQSQHYQSSYPNSPTYNSIKFSSNSNSNSNANNNNVIISPVMMSRKCYAQGEEQVVWSETEDLQNRIKKAIESSRTAIRRFKLINEAGGIM